MNISSAQDAASKLPVIEEMAGTEEYDDEIPEILGGEEKVLPQKGEEEPAPAESEPNSELPVEEPVAEVTTETPEDPEAAAVKEKALIFDQLSEALTRNPVGYIQHIMQGLTPEQKAALGQQPTQPVKDPGEEFGQDEILTPAERYLKTKTRYLEDLPGWSADVVQAIHTNNGALNAHQSEIVQLKATVAALSKAVGITLPDTNSPTYVKDVAASADKIVAQRTAAAKPTPRSMSNSATAVAGEELEARKNESLSQLFRRAKAAASK